MNIFEELDNLLNSVEKINEESKKSVPSVSYSDIPISEDMKTEEQARKYIRDYFIKQLLSKDPPPPPPDDSDEDSDFKIPPRVLPPTPPLPPILRKHLPIIGGGGKTPDAPKDWESEEIEWGEDEFIKRLELEAEALDEVEDEDDEKESKEGKDYDDFLDKSRGGVGSEGESGEKGKSSDDKDYGDSDEFDDVDDSTDDDTDDTDDDMDDDTDDDSKSSSKKKKKTDKDKTDKDKDGDEIGGGIEGDDEDGDETGGSRKSDLESAIEDVIERLKERTETEKEDLKELIDALKDEDGTVEDIEKKEEEIISEKTKSSEKYDKLKTLAGKLELAPSKEEIEKEIEASKLPPEMIEKMKEETVEGALSADPPTDSELDSLRREAMLELDRKCKGHSTLKSSILYHSLKAAEIKDDDWEKLVEKIITDKSIHTGEFEEKVKKIRLGDKNHLWRRDVRYTRKYEKGGAETQAIYCFVDYSGSVAGRPGLIAAFLGKILHLCFRLKYTDVCTYVFAENLSLPRIINNKMLKEDGYEKTLADTLAYFDSQLSSIGWRIENFSEVGYEINKIKTKDKNAIIFIFGDGYWTFYSTQTDPPTRLVEICPRWIKDIVAFIFYQNDREIKGTLGKEISVLRDVVEIDNVIVTKASKMKEDEWKG